jgi:hypothetical protein
MVGAPINAFHDGISRTHQLVVQPSGNETTDHRLSGVLATGRSRRWSWRGALS